MPSRSSGVAIENERGGDVHDRFEMCSWSGEAWFGRWWPAERGPGEILVVSLEASPPRSSVGGRENVLAVKVHAELLIGDARDPAVVDELKGTRSDLEEANVGSRGARGW